MNSARLTFRETDSEHNWAVVSGDTPGKPRAFPCLTRLIYGKEGNCWRVSRKTLIGLRVRPRTLADIAQMAVDPAIER